MTEDQHRTIMEEVVRAVDGAVERKVNGKIDGIKKQLDEHIASSEEFRTRIEPYLQVIAGSKILYKVFMVIGSVAVAWVAIKSVFNT